MAAPSGTVWGSVVGDYGRVGIHVALTHTATTTRRVVTLWFWSKYSVSDSTNTLYYDAGTTSASSSKGSVSISTSVSSGTGWSTSNQVKLKTYDHTYSRGTSNWSESCAMKLSGIDRVGGTMTATTSYTVPKLDSYTVSYNANGGTGAPGAQTKYYGKNITLSATKPTRTGYTFQGWATSASGAVAYQPGATYSANAGITLYAKWTAITYAVYYNGDGGTNIPSTQTKTYGVNLTLSSTKPTKTGYTFLGWATSAGGSVAYQPGQVYTTNAAVTLYARWQIITYSIIYDANGGTGAPVSQTKNYGSTLTLSPVEPTRTNYNFLGWSTNKSATSATYSAGGSYTANAAAIFYAVWKLAYVKPRITNMSITRCDVDGNLSDSGTYALLNFTYATDLKPRNPLITYMYNGEEQNQMLMIVVVQDPVTGEEIYSTKDTFNNVIVGTSVEGGPFSLETGHTISITVSDGEGGPDNTTIVPVNLPAMKFLIDFKSGGKGMAIGKPASTSEVLDVAWPIKEQGRFLKDKYIKRVSLTGQVQTGDYHYSVIALCKTSAANSSTGTYSSGRITFHRVNGLSGVCTVDVSMEDAYSPANGVNVNLAQRGFTYVTPCTFTYNGVTYGGLKVYLAAACLGYVDFEGVGNFDIFGLDYYHANNGVLNAEVNSSIKTISLYGSVGGSQYFHHNICIPNNTMIYTQNTAGTWMEAFCGCSTSGSTSLGYGSLTTKTGQTRIFGNAIEFNSNTNVTVTSGVFYANKDAWLGGIYVRSTTSYIDFYPSATTRTGRRGYMGSDQTNMFFVNEISGGSNYYRCNNGNHYFNKGVLIESGNLGSSKAYNVENFSIYCKWRDSANHDMVTRGSDGLGCALGWAGSASYATVVTIRGRTCKYQNASGTTTLSDRNLKKDFEGFSDAHDIFFDNLNPTTYKYILGSSGRSHFGYITQEVEEALESAGLTTKDFGGVNINKLSSRETETDDETGETKDIYNSATNYLLDKGIKEEHDLIYTEFISLNTWQIQKLKKRVNELESKVAEQDARIEKLEALVEQLLNQ